MRNHGCDGLARALRWVFWISLLLGPAAFADSPPTKPASIWVTSSTNSSVVLGWSAATDDVAVTGYQVERCEGANCNSSFTQFNTTSTSLVNSGLSPSTTYGYRVRAMDAVPNYSEFTSITYVTTASVSNDTQAPTVPAGLSIPSNSTTSSKVGMSWSASTDNVAVTGYQVERCTGAGCNSSFSQSNVSFNFFNDSGLTPTTTYGYRVRARDAVPNYSAFSGIVYVTTLAAPVDTEAPATPLGLTISVVTGGLRLAWQAPPDNVGVVNYLIDRCLASSCTYAQIANVWTTTSYTDTTVDAQTYRYKIRARDNAGNISEYSSPVTGSTAAGAEIRNYVSYEYDDAGRLRRANHPDTKQIAYTLDAAGNRRQVQNEVPPAAPTEIKVPATGISSGYTIEWVHPAPLTVTSYQLYEATQANFSGAREVTLEPSGPPPARTKLISGQNEGEYWYRVRACYQTVCSAYVEGANSITVGNPPGVPAVFDIPIGTTYLDEYTLSWSAASGNIVRYELYESPNGSFNPETPVYSGSGTSVRLTTRTAGPHHYRVRACGAIACGGYKVGSAPVTVVEPTIALNNVTISAGGKISDQPSSERFIGFSYQVKSNGELNIDRYGAYGSIEGWTYPSTWIAPSAANVAINRYEVRATTTTCNLDPQHVHADGVYDTWINLASAHAGWGISLFDPNYSFGCQITIEIRKASQPSAIVATAVINGSAWAAED